MIHGGSWGLVVENGGWQRLTVANIREWRWLNDISDQATTWEMRLVITSKQCLPVSNVRRKDMTLVAIFRSVFVRIGMWRCGYIAIPIVVSAYLSSHLVPDQQLATNDTSNSWHYAVPPARFTTPVKRQPQRCQSGARLRAEGIILGRSAWRIIFWLMISNVDLW